MGRRPDIDFLRIGATLLLFLFHTGKTFDAEPFFHIKNSQLSTGLNDFTGFIHLFHMPLFFLLAGWSLHASLKARTPGAFTRERIKRILIPFFAGTIIIGPIMKYLELKSVGPAGYDESFLEFLPSFFTRLDRFTWGHLWFLIYLFTFSMIYLPVFTALAARVKRNPPTFKASPWIVYLPIIPLFVVQTVLRHRWPGLQNLYDDWGNFAYYSLYLFIGFILSMLPRIETALHREGTRAGILGLLCLIPIAGPGLPWAYEWFFTTAAGYLLIVFMLSLAKRRVTEGMRGLGYLSEAAFPIYILHQTVIIVLGYQIIKLSYGIPVKFFMVLISSAIVTFGIYDFAVRRSNLLRFLTGMKPIAPSSRVVKPKEGRTV